MTTKINPQTGKRIYIKECKARYYRLDNGNWDAEATCNQRTITVRNFGARNDARRALKRMAKKLNWTFSEQEEDRKRVY